MFCCSSVFISLYPTLLYGAMLTVAPNPFAKGKAMARLWKFTVLYAVFAVYSLAPEVLYLGWLLR